MTTQDGSARIRRLARLTLGRKRFGFRVWVKGVGFRVSGFQGFRVSGFQGFRVSGFRVSGFQGFRVSGFQGLGFQGLEFRVKGLRVWGLG